MTELRILMPVPAPEAIRALRKAVGLTQAAMAGLLGLSSKSAIADYEAGRRAPSTYLWSLALLSLDLHPYYKLAPKVALDFTAECAAIAAGRKQS